MGRHTELLKASRDNDFSKMIELFTTGKAGKGFSTRITFKKKKEKAPAPVWDVEQDGSIKKMPKPASIRLDCRDDSGNTPLIIAALAGNLEAVECLIAYGASVNAKDSKGNTPLALASFSDSPRTEAVVETLLKNKADANICNSEGSSALHHACQFGKTYVLMMLLDAKGDPHHKNSFGDTPLDVAARFDRREVVSFLIDHDNSIIASTRSIREATRSGKTEIVKVLLDFGMDPGAQDPETGDSPLHISVRFFRVAVTELLLSFGADAFLKNAAGETPLGMVENYPESHPHKAKIKALVDEYREREIVTPAIELDKRQQRKAKEAAKHQRKASTAGMILNEYPQIKPLANWIKDPTKSCSSNAVTTCPVSNILDGKVQTYWLAQGTGRQWVVFDFGKPYTIVRLDLEGQYGKTMPKDYQLEMSPGPEGPWRVVVKGETKMDKSSGAYSEASDSFAGTSRYWKLQVLRNHGAPETHLGQVKFFGVDHMLKKWCTENGFVQYYDMLVMAGFNQVLSFKDDLDVTKLEEIMPLAGHRRKVQLAVDKLKGSSGLKFDRLVFASPAPEEIVCDEVIDPPIAVLAGPGLTEQVELVVHGGGVVTGNTKATLVPCGKNPSSARFNDVSISPIGEYTIEVRSVSNPSGVFVKAANPTAVVAPRARHAIEALFMEFDTLLAF
eukprot:m.345229 g.345229  ORF g.345229 m.345229 type:complete len:673 (+) comp20660_c0_seq1:138-2156(+)